ncbi:MAG TPA: hypothetical protein VFH29_08960, partial [Anaerolineales bacterium]|nr:hypothetical protein [Anaerolineales bacterium]
LLSIGLSVRALRQPKAAQRLTLLGLILQLVGLLPTEYFATLEPLRGLLLLAVLSGPTGLRANRGRALIRAWWPYLVVWVLNGIWLVYFYTSGAYISYDLTAAASPPATADVLRTFGDALFKAAAYVWVQVIPLTMAAILSPTSIATWGVILVSFFVLTFYLGRLSVGALNSSKAGAVPAPEEREHESERRRDGAQALGIGVAGILLGRLPSFAAGLPLTLQSSFDRLTISMMFAAALFVAGLLQLLVARPSVRMYLAAALVALAVGQQFFNANIFRRDWQRQQSIYWQLAWRVPDIQPDTAILTQQMPLDYETDLAMTAAVNWMYASEVKPPHLPLAVVYTEKRLGGVVLPALEPGVPMRLPLRTMTFLGNTSQVIAIYVPPAGCLRVFDPQLDDAVTYSRLPETVTAAIPLSDPRRIIGHAEARRLPSPPFSAEPKHEWCYVYEKAELARQDRDWSKIIRLRAEARENGLEPVDPFEWLPFIEAEGRQDYSAWAANFSLELVGAEPKLQRGLCALWARIATTESGATREAAAGMQGRLACGP